VGLARRETDGALARPLLLLLLVVVVVVL